MPKKFLTHSNWDMKNLDFFLGEKDKSDLKKTYVIDTSSLINLGKWYPANMRIFQPIWLRIEELVREGNLISHIEVYREISQKDDEIFKWCKKHKEIFLEEYDPKTLKIVETKYPKDYWDRNSLWSKQPWADPWLIVLAIKNGASIVTDEGREKRTNIPHIASQFGINCLKILEFFKDIGLS